MNNPSIRIGVLGDLHVAKSELVHKICHPRSATPAATSDWAGPTVDILDFHRPSANANAWIEFIVFPSETKHPLSRQMLYGAQIDAVFLVCDCTLPRTFVHGYKWMEEAVQVLEEGATVPVAVILGGPMAIDIGIADAVQKLIEPLVDTYKAIVLDLSGFTGAPTLEPRQRSQLGAFFETVLCKKFPTAST